MCEGVCILLSIIVCHKTFPPTWISFFIFFFFFFCTLTLMSNFVLLTESMWDTTWKLATENGDPLYGQTLCHPWVAKPRYHHICLISMVLAITGLRHEMYETYKQVGSGLVAKVKRLEKIMWWQAYYEKRLHFFEDVSILLWHITTTTHNLY